MIIDLHAHYFPPRFSELWDSYAGGRISFPKHPVELGERIEDLEASGIDIQVNGLGHNQPNFESRDHSVEVARLANDLYAEAFAEHGGRLRAFGALPLPHVEDSLEELRRCMDELRFAGIGIGTSICGKNLDDDSFEPLWAELDSRGTAVFLHPVGTPDTMIVGMDSAGAGFRMSPKFGGPVEATVAVVRLVLSGVTTRYPNINFIVAPLGGTLPFLWRRYEWMTEGQVKAGIVDFGTDDPRAELRKIYYDTSLDDDPQSFLFAANVLGLRSIVLGTDSPRVKTAEIVDFVRSVPGVAGDDQAAVLGGTAERLLAL